MLEFELAAPLTFNLSGRKRYPTATLKKKMKKDLPPSITEPGRLDEETTGVAGSPWRRFQPPRPPSKILTRYCPRRFWISVRISVAAVDISDCGSLANTRNVS